MLGAGWTEAVAFAAAFVISAVTPTNLLYNVVSTPGALYRYRRQHQTGGRLASSPSPSPPSS